MLISFVIPAYNESKNIGACIDAIQQELTRTGYDCEIIVVDNACTDTTAMIAKARGARVVRENQKGLVFARECGYRASTGELVAHIDADTRIEKGWVQYAADSFKKNPKLVVLSGPYTFYDGTFFINTITSLFHLGEYALYILNRFVFRAGGLVQGGNFIIRRTALDSAGGFNTSISFFGEDTDIARRLYPFGTMVFTFKLRAKSSARRLKGDGVIITGWRYLINFVWMMLFKRAFTNSYNDFR